MIHLARCCESRRRQLERLADRCDEIGLASNDVQLLVDLADCYAAFGRELGKILDEADPAIPARPGQTVDRAFRDVMNGPFSNSEKRAVRRAFRRRFPASKETT